MIGIRLDLLDFGANEGVFLRENLLSIIVIRDVSTQLTSTRMEIRVLGT